MQANTRDIERLDGQLEVMRSGTGTHGSDLDLAKKMVLFERELS